MAEKTQAVPPLASVGILGGSGLYAIDGFEGHRDVRIRTPFGDPSGPYVVGTLEGRRVAFLARHGQGHRLLPAEVNYRANIFGSRSSASRGSSRSLGRISPRGHPSARPRPGRPVLRPDLPSGTFFGGGIVAHVSLGQPVCAELAGILHGAAVGLGLRARRNGTYICIDGPAFSTKAESHAYRAWAGTSSA